MTEKLFYKDAYIKEFEAKVISCAPAKGGFELVLDKTAFYPEGGGQPCDTGTVNGKKITYVSEKDGVITHICEAEFTPGESVECALNFERRFLNMQLHTGEHILSGFINQLTGFDNVGFHMGENAITIDFNGAIDEKTLEKAELLANRKIWENVEIIEHYPTREELSSITYRSKKELTGQVRLVEIPGADMCACCGTHVKRTGEVGTVKVLFAQNYKGGVRITMQAGSRAFNDYCAINSAIRSAGALLKVPPEEVPAAVEKLLLKAEAQKAENTALKRKIFASLAETVPAGTESCRFFIEGEADEARELCDLLCDRAGIAAVFAAGANGVKYCIGSRTADVRPIGKSINTLLSGRGGGKPEMVQGSVTADEAAATAAFDRAVKEITDEQ